MQQYMAKNLSLEILRIEVSIRAAVGSGVFPLGNNFLSNARRFWPCKNTFFVEFG